MHNMSKELTKSDSQLVDAAVTAFVGILDTMQGKAAAFQRKLVLDGVRAITKLHATIADIDGAPSIDKLHRDIAEGNGNVSKSTLDRWGRVAAIHTQLGVTPSEGSASAVYAITESGWTEARDAIKQLESVESADQLVEIIAETMNNHPRAVKAPAAREITPADVESADYTPEAFAASVIGLLDRVPADKVDEARKQLRAIVNGYKRETVNA